MSTDTMFNRRNFLKGALVAGTAAALGGVAGCASEQLPATGEAASNASKLVSSMNQEERAQAVADSTFMGGDTDYYGRELITATGPKGQTTTQYVMDYLSKFPTEVLEEVCEGVHVTHTHGLCNIVMIEGKTGMILIDTSGCIEDAEKDLELLRSFTDKPIAAIIYSHDHYCFGTSVYVPEGNPDNIPLIAHSNLMDTLARTIGAISPTYSHRSSYQFNTMCPAEGEDGFLLGAVARDETYGFIEPNTLIPSNVHMTEMEIDGLHFEFYPGIADSPCSLSVYCKEYDTLYSNHVMPCFQNMYTLRGEKYRDPDKFIPDLDTLRAIGAENFIASAFFVVRGKENVLRELTYFRDAVQFVQDQTIRYMNMNYTPDECVKAVKMPASIVQASVFTTPCYGEVEHYVRGVYGGLIGWFGNDAIDLHPVTKEFEYGKLVEALGGDDAVAAAAQSALDDNQYAWAGKLATYVLTNNPDHEAAKAVKADALRKMGHVSHSSITRSFCISQAYELEGKTDTEGATFLGVPTRDKLIASPSSLFFDTMRIHLDPEKSEGVVEGLTMTFPDINEAWTLSIRNCVAAIEEGKTNISTTEITLPYESIVSVLVGETTLADCVANGTATVSNADTYNRILGLFDKEF